MENETDEVNPRIDGDGKVTLSFAPHEWIGIFISFAVAVGYVIRIETAVHDHDKFKMEQQAINQAQLKYNDENTRAHDAIGRSVNKNTWRIRRVEKRLGLKAPEEMEP